MPIAGTGQSDLTWQVFGGVGYTFSWGSAVAGWRYLDYDFTQQSRIKATKQELSTTAVI